PTGRSSSAHCRAARSRRCRARSSPSSSAAATRPLHPSGQAQPTMRIIAGSHRGRALVAPQGDLVRPTSDRAREALFNILAHGTLAASGPPYAGARVLDAFAGTGALGLEALSRGAAGVAFIENSRTALTTLRQNISALGETARTQIV